MGLVPLSEMGINDTNHYIDYGMSIITIVQTRAKVIIHHKKAYENLTKKDLCPKIGANDTIIS